MCRRGRGHILRNNTAAYLPNWLLQYNESSDLLWVQGEALSNLKLFVVYLLTGMLRYLNLTLLFWFGIDVNQNSIFLLFSLLSHEPSNVYFADF